MSHSQKKNVIAGCSSCSSSRRRQTRKSYHRKKPTAGACQTYRQLKWTDCERGRWLVLYKQSGQEWTFQRKYVACDSWQCPVCSQIKKRKIYKMLKKACPKSEFYLLTCTLRENDLPLSVNWKRLSKCWNTFLSNLRKKHGKIRYFRCVELHKNGMPHIHALINVHMTKRKSHDLWHKITKDSFKCEFEKIKYSCAGYIIKYLQKGLESIETIRKRTGSKTKLFVYSRFLLVREVHTSDWSLWSMHRGVTMAIQELQDIKNRTRSYYGRDGPLLVSLDKDGVLLGFSFHSFVE